LCDRPSDSHTQASLGSWSVPLGHGVMSHLGGVGARQSGPSAWRAPAFSGASGSACDCGRDLINNPISHRGSAHEAKHQVGRESGAHRPGSVCVTEVGREDSFRDVEVALDDGSKIDAQLDGAPKVASSGPGIETEAGAI